MDGSQDSELASMVELLRSLAEQKRKTGGQDTRVSFKSLLQTHLENVATVKETINLFVFGLSGAGKSTAINTIFGQRVRETARGYSGEAGPLGVTKDIDPVDLFTITSDSGKTCKLVLWDVPGLTGRRGGFDFGTELQEKIPDPDLTLLCVPMDANNGRPLPIAFQSSFEKLKSIKDGVYTRNSIVLLTKANLVADAFEKEFDDQKRGRPSDGWHTEFSERVADWKKVVKEAVEDLGLPPMPVIEYGEILFGGRKLNEISVITDIGPLGKGWIVNAYRKMIHCATCDEMRAGLFLHGLEFGSDPLVSAELKSDLPGLHTLGADTVHFKSRILTPDAKIFWLFAFIVFRRVMPNRLSLAVANEVAREKRLQPHGVDKMYTVDEFDAVLESLKNGEML